MNEGRSKFEFNKEDAYQQRAAQLFELGFSRGDAYIGDRSIVVTSEDLNEGQKIVDAAMMLLLGSQMDKPVAKVLKDLNKFSTQYQRDVYVSSHTGVKYTLVKKLREEMKDSNVNMILEDLMMHQYKY